MAVAYIVMVGAVTAISPSYSLTLHRIIICIMMAQISHSKAVPQSMPVTVVCGVLMISALLSVMVGWFMLPIMPVVTVQDLPNLMVGQLSQVPRDSKGRVLPNKTASLIVIVICSYTQQVGSQLDMHDEHH